MQNKLQIDQLNTLDKEQPSKQKSIPYEEYFGEMDITRAEANRRILLAESLEDVFRNLFYLTVAAEVITEALRQDIVNQVAKEYMDALERNSFDIYGKDSYLRNYVYDGTEMLFDATQNHRNDPYYTSEDRVIYVSENEANAIANNEEFRRAIEQGYTKKKWVSLIDRKVRHTHRDVNGLTIDITLPFEVGDSLMMYPKDYETYGAEAKEIVNCRCSIKYLDKRERKTLITEDGTVLDKDYVQSLQTNNGQSHAVTQSYLQNTLQITIQGVTIEPPKEFDNESVRIWYYDNVHNIPNLLDSRLPIEEQSRLAYALRTELKIKARELMFDRKMADYLNEEKKPLTYEELIEHKASKYGMNRDEAIKDIIRSSATTNPDVDAEFGLGRKNEVYNVRNKQR